MVLCVNQCVYEIIPQMLIYYGPASLDSYIHVLALSVYTHTRTHAQVFLTSKDSLFLFELGLVKDDVSVCAQEPGPAKVTVTSTSSSMVCLPSTIANAERVPSTRASLWQEETWSRATIPTSCSTGSLSQLSEGNHTHSRAKT